MDRGAAGISGKYTTSGNDYKKPHDHANSSRRGRSGNGTVEWVNTPNTYTPRGKGFYNTSGACSSHYPSRRTVKPIQDFDDLITPEKIAHLATISDKFGARYDGRTHSQLANSIKQYTSASRRPLDRDQISQLVPFLQTFKPKQQSWSWRSLTTTFHSLTSAGVFTPHKRMDETVKHSQANLLSTLLDVIKLKCSQKPEPRDIDAQGIANLLWAMAKLVDNGQERTAELKAAVAALLPHVNAQKDQFNAQGIANLLWAMAKLVDNGQERTAELKAAVAALLPHVNAQKDQFNAQGIANLLWAMAKLVDNGQERTAELKAAVAALLPHVNAQKAGFKPQEVANLLWAMAKLVDNGQERTAELKASVAALLPHVNAQKDQFNAQGIATLLWAMAKLVDNGQERTAELKASVAALLPHVNAQKAGFKPQEVANLLWAMAKLVDNGQERTAELKAAVAALLPQVNAQKANFKPQEVANLLWAMAKLLDNGQERTAELKAAVAALLPHVNAQKDQFIPQHIANLLWAMAKLVDNGQERTAEFKAAVAALLPHVNAQKASFKPQEITNLLWAMAKLVDNGQERTAELKAAVAALLPHVNAQKDQFIPQHIANLLWAMAKLVDNGQERTAELNAAVAALLAHVNAQKEQFNAQDIANLLWAMAKLGEAIELSLVESTFESLVYISENPQRSQQDAFMSLWAVMAYCARLSLSSNATKNNLFEKHIENLFTRLETTSPDNEDYQSIIAMAALWLGRECPVVPNYQKTISKSQSGFRDQLKSSIPSLMIEEEVSLNSLPPVDLLLRDQNIVFEVQGPSHYVGGDFKTRNGSTLLRIALLQKLGFNVIEIPVNKLGNHELMGMVIDQIRAKSSIPPEARGSVSLKSGGV